MSITYGLRSDWNRYGNVFVTVNCGRVRGCSSLGGWQREGTTTIRVRGEVRVRTGTTRLLESLTTI